MAYAMFGACVFLAIYVGMDADRARRFWLEPEFIISVTIPPFLHLALDCCSPPLWPARVAFDLSWGVRQACKIRC